MKNLLILIFAVTLSSCTADKRAHSERPNFLWITCEDISPNLGSYGCKEAQTPNLDELANRAIRYITCWQDPIGMILTIVN